MYALDSAHKKVKNVRRMKPSRSFAVLLDKGRRIERQVDQNTVCRTKLIQTWNLTCAESNY